MLCMCLCVNVVRAVFVRDFALLMERANRLREGVVGQALFRPVAFPHSFNIIQSIAQPHRASASSSSPDQPDRWQVFSSGRHPRWITLSLAATSCSSLHGMPVLTQYTIAYKEGVQGLIYLPPPPPPPTSHPIQLIKHRDLQVFSDHRI